jgi:Flp pilus assembly protein TadG
LGGNRPGKALAMFVVMLPVMLGMVGVTIDSGLMLVVYRQTQNAADAGALAAAVDLKNNLTVGTAKSTASTYIQTYNNLTNATVTVHSPPTSGPYSGNIRCAEAIVTSPYTASFLQVLHMSRNESVTARAVAGWEPQAIVALSASGIGINVSNTGKLAVNGSILVNSLDSSKAVVASGSGLIYTKSISVAGAVSGASNIQDYPSGGGTGGLAQNTGKETADPLASTPVPTTSNGVLSNFYSYTFSGGQWHQATAASAQAVTINNTTAVTLSPGIYKSITVLGGANVTFSSGIYVLEGAGLTINSSTANGSGVMFYNTSSTYNPSNGSDGASTPTGKFTISGSTANLTGLNNSSSNFDGILFFQDRANSQTVTMSGNSGSSNLSGAIYAPAAPLSVSGTGTWAAQFIVSSVSISGSANITLDYSGISHVKVAYVFMVE